MTEEKIVCSECNEELVMKFIELKDLVFCSNRCLERYKDTMGQKKFYRVYGDVFASGEGKGWVPKHSNESRDNSFIFSNSIFESIDEQIICFGYI